MDQLKEIKHIYTAIVHSIAINFKPSSASGIIQKEVKIFNIGGIYAFFFPDGREQDYGPKDPRFKTTFAVCCP